MTHPQHASASSAGSSRLGLVRWGVTGGALVATLVALVVAGPIAGLFVGLIGVFVVNGVWLGAAEQLGGFIAILLALALSGLVGGLLEPVVASFGQTGGLVLKLVSRGVAILVVAVPLGIVLAAVFRAVLRKHPRLRAWNTGLGAGFGALEGVLVAMLALWIPVMLGPVAEAQAEAARARANDLALPGEPARPVTNTAVAELVAAWERRVRDSALGALAVATAPTAGVEMIAIANEFAVITRDEAAMRRLLDDPVMVEINALPSVQAALDRLRHDPEMRAALEGDAISPERLWSILQSDEVLDALDDTGAFDDVRSRAPEIARAIAEVRRSQHTRLDRP
jgi:hypothetical protein